MPDATTLAKAAEVLAGLRRHCLMMVTAESCTGGLIAASLTHHAGSSASICGGYVTYSNEMKHRALGVPSETLRQFGAVSAQTAGAMSAGALLCTPDATLAVSVTGIAGPGGGSPEKPVGLVWFGIAGPAGMARQVECRFTGDREQIRIQSVAFALDLVLARIAELDAGT